MSGPAYSEKVTAGSSTTWTDYIAADGRLVAMRTLSGGAASFHYMVGDHLGSTSVVTDASAAVVERDSYDAWGKRRNADFSPDTTCALTSTTTRGFTGQEHVDPLCLENFNARMYDPLLARFSSADSIVADGFDGQSFNRYAYARGNPLNAVDPSGHGTQPASDSPTQCKGGGNYCHPDDAMWNNPGIPCWGCWGPGETTDSNGNVIQADNYDSYTITRGDGSVTTYSGDFAGLMGVLDGIGYENFASGIPTHFNLGSADGPTFLRFAITQVGVGEGGGPPVPGDSGLVIFDGVNAGMSSGTFGPMHSGRSGDFAWSFSTFNNDGQLGERMRIRYLGDTRGLQWIQVVTAHGASPSDNDGQPFNDHEEGSEYPFYDSNHLLNQSPYNLQPGEFYDDPSRGGASEVWTAQTSLVRVDGSGGWSVIATFSWGFQVSGNDVTLLPVRIKR